MSALASHQSDLHIHLGDVYYAGTYKTIFGGQGEEQKHFLNSWVNGSLASFSLNSNHEMNSGATGYFKRLLADSRFQPQSQTTNKKASSFFVIEYGDWVIIGLDTAYFTTDFLSLNGTIRDPAQIQLLKQYGKSDKKLFLLSHHNGISYDGKRNCRYGEK